MLGRKSLLSDVFTGLTFSPIDLESWLVTVDGNVHNDEVVSDRQVCAIQRSSLGLRSSIMDMLLLYVHRLGHSPCVPDPKCQPWTAGLCVPIHINSYLNVLRCLSRFPDSADNSELISMATIAALGLAYL